MKARYVIAVVAILFVFGSMAQKPVTAKASARHNVIEGTVPASLPPSTSCEYRDGWSEWRRIGDLNLYIRIHEGEFEYSDDTHQISYQFKNEYNGVKSFKATLIFERDNSSGSGTEERKITANETLGANACSESSGAWSIAHRIKRVLISELR